MVSLALPIELTVCARMGLLGGKPCRNFLVVVLLRLLLLLALLLVWLLWLLRRGRQIQICPILQGGRDPQDDGRPAERAALDGEQQAGGAAARLQSHRSL